MNFAQVRQAMGQKDDRGYDIKVTMFATFGSDMQFGKTKKGGDKCSVTLIQDDGESHKAHLYGTLPTPAMCNQRAQFDLSAYNGSANGKAYTGYSGFWNDRVQVTQAQPQQPVPNAYGQPNVPSPAADVVAEPTYVAAEPAQRDFGAEEKSKQTSIERQVCVKAVGDMVVSRPQMDKYAAADWLSFYQGWIETGTFPFDVTHKPVDTTDFTLDDDLPPELRDNYQR